MSLATTSRLLALLIAPLLVGATTYLGSAGPVGSPPRAFIAADETLHLKEFLTGGTTTGVIVSILPDLAIHARVNYGLTSRMGTRTATVTTTQDIRKDIPLTGLTAGTRYWYQVETKLTTEFRWGTRGFNNFTTLRAAGQSYRFGIGSDPHAPQRWTVADCGDNTADSWPEWLRFESTIRNSLGHDLEFWLDLGDTVMNHTAGTPTKGCDIGGEDMGKGTLAASGDANTTAQRQAELRWQILLMGAGDSNFGYQSSLQLLPFFFVLGNHDGETPWGDADGQCNYYDGNGAVANTNTASLAARKLALPNPFDTYNALQPDATAGDSDGRYYTWASGDARFFALDVYQGTEPATTGKIPAAATDWALGADQKTWFAAQLADTTETWKIVTPHALPGGAGPAACSDTYSYGRGGPKSTDTGLITGTMTGTDMAWLQAQLAATTGGVIVHGHDHVAAAAEKLDSNGLGTGVHYLSAPTAGAQALSVPIEIDDNYDNNGIIEASAGPVLMTSDGTGGRRGFDCATCDFVADGFAAKGILDSANFPASVDGLYEIQAVSATAIDIAVTQGDAATLTTETGDGDETLQMRLADYDEDPPRQGSTSEGWYRVTVTPSSLVFDHIISSTGSDDNTVAFTYRIGN